MSGMSKENDFDAIIIGSGTSGATIAKELCKQKRKVLILERGTNVPLSENFWRMASVFNEVSVSDKMASPRAITAGGSTALYAAMAELPPLDSFLSLGINLSQELEEAENELPLAQLPDELIGAQAIRLRESALALGYPWKKNLMLIDQAKCTSGYSYDAKWKAKSYMVEAIENGATLITQATVLKIIVAKKQAIGVEYKFGNRICQAYGKKIVLAAGVFASPIILRDSGIKNVANHGFYCSPGFLMAGTIPTLHSKDNYVGCMSAELEDGIVVGDANLSRSFYKMLMLSTFNLSRIFSHSTSIAIGGMVKDEMGGGIQKDGRFYKELTKEDRRKLKKAEDIAAKILTHSGAKKIVYMGPDAGTVGGLLRIREHLDEKLETEYSNLHVCDGSMIPEDIRMHPTLTLVCLGKYLAKNLFTNP